MKNFRIGYVKTLCDQKCSSNDQDQMYQFGAILKQKILNVCKSFRNFFEKIGYRKTSFSNILQKFVHKMQ